MLRSSFRSDSATSPVPHFSRSSSISSSITSPGSRQHKGLFAAPSAIPPPAYISTEGACDTLATAYSGRASPDPEEPTAFAEGAVAQINAFLDYLLYNFLSTARSSTLAQIRPAVEHVIRGRLAQQAIASADEELNDLLNGAEDDDELAVAHKEQDPSTTWELEPVWKRTRLRIMVYVRLGNMEDDDEERYVEQEQLQYTEEASEHRFSQRSGLVSWAALIFLTAVLEHIAERCVKDASQFAGARVSVSRPHLVYRDDGSSTLDPTDEQLTVKEHDVRKLGLSPTLGRMWRTWKKCTPKPSPSIVPGQWRPFSGRDSRMSQTVSEFSSSEGPQTAQSMLSTTEEPQKRAHAHHVSEPPKGDHAIPRKIQPYPGFRRSRSFSRFPVIATNTPAGSWPTNTDDAVQRHWPRPSRSSSLPTPSTKRWSPSTKGQTEEMLVATADGGEAPEKAVESVPHDISEGKVGAGELGAEGTPVNTEDPVGRSQERQTMVLPIQTHANQGMDDDDVSHISRSREASQVVQPSSALRSSEEDEYDPYRVDLAPPVALRSSRNTSPAGSAHGTPVEQRPDAMSYASPADRRDRSASAALMAGVASTAILGSSAQMRKKDKAGFGTMDSVNEQIDPRTFGRDSPTTGRTTPPRRPPEPSTVSPLKNTVQPSDLQQVPSPSMQRTNTSDSDSEYETPPRSPINKIISNATRTPSNDQPSSRRQPSGSSVQSKSTSIRKQSSGSNTKPSRIITDDSGMKSSHGTSVSPSERDFNTFVSSNDTVKRSLTPRNLVEIESPDSPRLRQEQFGEAMSARAADYAQASGRNGIVPRADLARTNLPTNERAAMPRRAEEASLSSRPLRDSSKGTKSGLLARDARVQTAATSELAEYLRSTAPSKPPAETLPFIPSTPTTPVSANPGTPGLNSRQPSARLSTENMGQRMGTFSAKSQGLVKPRTAKVERQANDDLISFLNDGPPGAYVSKKRSVETTNSRTDYPMTYSSANRSSSQTSQSYQESVNSHSALVNKIPAIAQKSADQRTPSSPLTKQAPAKVNGSDGGPPARKQRRVKDPYAIESEDEGNDILTGLPRAHEESESGGGRGESLMDFLRNSGPPDDSGKLKTAVGGAGSGAGARRQPLGTSSTAVGGPSTTFSTAIGGPYSNKHIPIASNQDIKGGNGVGGGSSTSTAALPGFLKDSRATITKRPSTDEGKKGRMGGRQSDSKGGGMKGFFRKIGVNG